MGPRPIIHPQAPGFSFSTSALGWRRRARQRRGRSRDEGRGEASGPGRAQWRSVPKAAHSHANARGRLVMRLDKPL